MRHRVNTSRSAIGAFAAAWSVAAAFAQPAPAAEPASSSFSIRPISGDRGFFVFPARRGATLQGSVRIVNTGAKAGTVRLYPVDGTTGATSGAVYLGREAPRRGVARWVKLALSRLTLAPGQDRIVSFSVRVPRRVRGGHHLGGIVAENLELTGGASAPQRGGLQIRVRHLSIVAVQVNVPGRAIPALSFRGVKPRVSASYEVLYLTLRATGNVLVRPRLSARVTNMKGRIVARRTLQLDTFVPKTTIRYPLYLLRKPLPAGRYRLVGTLRYAGRLTRFSAFFGISQELVRQLPAAVRPPATVARPVEPDTPGSLSWEIVGAAVAAALLFGIAGGALLMRLRPGRSR